VPPPDDDEPALEPVGERIALDDASDTGGPPVLAWDGSGWGAAWFGRFRVLDADGRPLSSTTSLPTGWTAGIGLDFAIGRYALVTADAARAFLGAFDRGGRLAAGWESGAVASELDVGRLDTAHQWIVGTLEGSSIGVYGADNAMRPVSDTLRIADDGIGDVRVAGAKSRALLVWNTPSSVMAQVLRAPPLTPDGSPLHAMEVVTHSDGGLEVEVFRDLVAIVAMDGRDVHLVLVDAWRREVRVGPLRVGSSGIVDRRPGLAVSPEHGFFVTCWAAGRGPAGGSDGGDGVALQVVGADGSLWGTRLDLVRGERNIGGVDCGWNGREIVVVWWRAAGDGAWNTIFSQRARPTFL
jgi:hypothetical protein